MTFAHQCRAINDSGVCPSIVFINTENVYIDMKGTLASDDPRGQRKVDASGMLRSGPNEPKLPVEPDWSRMKVTLEFKRVVEDPVVDPNPKLSQEDKKGQVMSDFSNTTSNAYLCPGSRSPNPRCYTCTRPSYFLRPSSVQLPSPCARDLSGLPRKVGALASLRSQWCRGL